MCLEPITLKDRTQVACRTCGICRENRLNDLIGRCAAEQTTASRTLAVTLTYAGDTPNSVVLIYRDVQLFLKRLRKDGYSVRYICAGEFGEEKGRAHWHIVLFFDGKSPDLPVARYKNDPNARTNWDFWPHGFVYTQQPDYKGFKYILKYVLKQDPRQGQSKALSMSKKPPLGYDYFIRLAEKAVDAGLPIREPSYSFSHVLKRDGLPRKFWLQGRMREIYLEHYVAAWRERYGSEPPHSSWLTENHLDKIARQELDRDPYLLDRRAAQRKRQDDLAQERKRTAEFKEKRLADRVVVADGWTATLYNDNTCEIQTEEGQPWLVSAETNVPEQLRASGLPKPVQKQVWQLLLSAWLTPRPRKPS